MINIEGIVVIVGNYGSGKTEVSINLAVNRKRDGIDVRMADLDIVNPYFRTREAKDVLEKFGIEVVLPPDKYLNADLPILSPKIRGLIRLPSQLTILDVGGDDAGATILATFSDVIPKKQVHMFGIFNPLRPFANTIEGCMKIKEKIERASGLTMTGIIGNAHMIDETTTDTIYQGYEFMNRLSKESGLALIFITCPVELLSGINPDDFSCPILPIERQLVPPWKQAVHLT